jgi:hypothetical protein
MTTRVHNRSGIVKSPERPDFTCIQKRVIAKKSKRSLVESVE